MSRLLLLLPLFFALGCGDTIIHNDSDSLTGPSPATLTHRVEFRVSGNATSARVRFSNPVDGLTQVVTGLPYVVSTSTTQPSMFLSLEAIPLGYNFNNAYPYMAVQIFVDSSLFREATSNEFTLNPVVVSGTWRSGSILSPSSSSPK